VRDQLINSQSVVSHAIEDLPLLTTCMSDPIEITCERDSLTISCDFSGCTHATTHTLDVPMRIA
jgi:hypothetical protein